LAKNDPPRPSKLKVNANTKRPQTRVVKKKGDQEVGLTHEEKRVFKNRTKSKEKVEHKKLRIWREERQRKSP
jgi:hypothetical protein